MKAIMSDKLREIINDPKKAEALDKGISQLGVKTGHTEKEAEVSIPIGSDRYKIKFITPESE